MPLTAPQSTCYDHLDTVRDQQQEYKLHPVTSACKLHRPALAGSSAVQRLQIGCTTNTWCSTGPSSTATYLCLACAAQHAHQWLSVSAGAATHASSFVPDTPPLHEQLLPLPVICKADPA